MNLYLYLYIFITCTCTQCLFGHKARAAASEDQSLALRASTDRLPVGWRRPRGRPRQSWLRTINWERSQTAQPWTTLCIAANYGSSFLATHRGNGYALRACHLMMMTCTHRTAPKSHQNSPATVWVNLLTGRKTDKRKVKHTLLDGGKITKYCAAPRIVRTKMVGTAVIQLRLDGHSTAYQR